MFLTVILICLSALLKSPNLGVAAQNQADSYKRMVNGDWVFGVEHAWVLAPTRSVFNLGNTSQMAFHSICPNL